MRKQVEYILQAAILAWTLQARHEYPELNLLLAIPNGGHRSWSEAKRLRATGVKAGVPDLFLPVARGSCHGLWLELKAPHGRVSPAQKLWREALVGQGYAWGVVTDLKRAQIVLIGYLRT